MRGSSGDSRLTISYGIVCAITAKPAGFRARFTGDERLLVAIDMDTEDFSCVEGDTPPAPLETGGGLWWTNFALLLHRDDLKVDEAQQTVWTDLTPDPPTVQDDTRVKRWDVTQSAFDCGKLIEKTAVELKKTGN